MPASAIVKNLKSTLKSMPYGPELIGRYRQLARRVANKEPLDGFHTLSPDVLVALTKAFNLQRAQRDAGRDLFSGHGYYEFGLFRGFSLWFSEQLSRECAGKDFIHLGFDSFEGLPQPELEVEARAFSKGDFCGTYEVVTQNLKRWNAEMSRIRLHRGFYSTEHFDKLRREHAFPPISICLIDVDLYESCAYVLDFICDRLVEGSVLLFDDYNQFGEDNDSGERRALHEFEQRHPSFQKEHLFDYGWEGVAFRVTTPPRE